MGYLSISSVGFAGQFALPFALLFPLHLCLPALLFRSPKLLKQVVVHLCLVQPRQALEAREDFEHPSLPQAVESRVARHHQHPELGQAAELLDLLQLFDLVALQVQVLQPLVVGEGILVEGGDLVSLPGCP